MSGGIYFIKCIENQTIYVGSAKEFEKRFGAHLGDLRDGKHRNPHLQHSYNKYGKESFEFIEFEVLGEYDKDVYFAEENSVMEMLRANGEKLFNIARAEGGWTFATKERKAEIGQKISKTLKDKASKMSEEERKEIFGKGKKDIPLSENRKRELSKYWTGKTKSEETKKRMSDAQKNNPKNEENGKRLGKSNIGKTPANALPIEIDGVSYKSIKHAARELNVEYFTLLSKLFPEKYATSGKSNKRKIKIDGQVFDSKSAAAKYFKKSITWVSNHGEIINE